eukprot:7432170-Pyramimonas_sp.AAC.1
MAQDGPKRASGNPRYPPRSLKMSQDGPHDVPRRSKNSPRRFQVPTRASLGCIKEAKMLHNPRGNQCFWCYHFFACDAHPRRQCGSKMAQYSPKKGPRKPHDGAKGAEERSKSGPRA